MTTATPHRRLPLLPLFLTIPTLLAAAEEPPEPAALTPLAPAAFDRAAAAHLLSRAGFSGPPREIDQLYALGLEKAVESLLEPGGPLPAEAFEGDTLELAMTDRVDRRALRTLDREERQKLMRRMRQKNRKQFQALRGRWFRRMVVTPRPLEEKMTLFWHGHFATSQRGVGNSYHMYLQNRTLRAYALGNFKGLTHAISKDPAMLKYLNNQQNRRLHPNENFARELMELFTLGVGHYTEDDIKEAARAFTGWTFRGKEFFFRHRVHDYGEKKFLGHTGDFNGEDVIDIIFAQPAASRFIARKVFVYFVHEDPSAKIVEHLAEILRSHDFEIRPLLERLFMSAEFYSATARGTQIKSPVRLVAGTLRTLEMDPGSAPVFAFICGRMGQDILLPPSVKGWDGGRSWISTSTIFHRYNFARPILGLEARRGPGEGGPAGRNLGEGGKITDALPALPQWDTESGRELLLGADSAELDPADVVDRVVRRLLLVEVSAEARRQLIDFYTLARPETRLEELIHLVISSPEYQLG